MRLIDADELLELWDELWDDHCVTQSELHHIIKDKWPDIHIYSLEELSEKSWHYPSKGELPPRTGEYLVYFHTMTGYYTDVRELNPELNNLTYGVGECVVAWQYIVPPKEIKEE